MKELRLIFILFISSISSTSLLSQDSFGLPTIVPQQGYDTYNLFGNIPENVGMQHAGMDYANYKGQPVLAIADGFVKFTEYTSDWDHNMGTSIILEHIDNEDYSKLYSAYFHLNSIFVEEGDYVLKGEKIATIGHSGDGCDNYWDCDNNINCDCTYNPLGHLHLEMRKLINLDFPTSGPLLPNNPVCTGSDGRCYGYVGPNQILDNYGYIDPNIYVDSSSNKSFKTHINKIISVDVSQPLPTLYWETNSIVSKYRLQIFKSINGTYPNIDNIHGFNDGSFITNSKLVVNYVLDKDETDFTWFDFGYDFNPNDGIYENASGNQIYYAILKSFYDFDEADNNDNVFVWTEPILFTINPADYSCLVSNENNSENLNRSSNNQFCNPDVFMSNYLVSENLTVPGSTITISVDQNLSDFNYPNELIKLNYYLSQDIEVSANDILIGNDYSSIGEDPFDSEFIQYTIPNLSPGTYYILFEADADNTIQNEENETNNIVGIPITISNPSSQINLTTHQNSFSGNAGDGVIISGNGSYDNGDQVFVGNITITTSEASYTTTMLNGNFSKLVHLPSNSGNINVHLTDGTYSDSKSISVSINGSSNGNGYDVLNYTTCISDDNQNMPCEFFSDHIKDYEDVVFFWTELINCTGPTQAKFVVKQPDGSIYLDQPTNFYNGSYTYFYYGMNVNPTIAADHQGEWKVDYYARKQGNAWDYIGTKTFVLSHIYAEHKICKNVVNDQPVDVTNTFCNSDSRMYSWVHYTDQCNGLDLKFEWYEPDGSLFDDVTFALSDPGPEPQAWVPDRYQWFYYDISTTSMKHKTGSWQIKYYVKDPFGNWDLEYSDNFEITECPNTNPDVTVTKNGSIDETQNLKINIDVFDIGYLNNVILYYDSGNGWQTISYNNINSNNFLKNNIILGSFLEGTNVKYYVEATDNSGNVGGSGINSIIIGDSDSDGPIISNVTITEENGNGDGYFQDNEELKIQCSLSDPSGISDVYFLIDGIPIQLNGNYFSIEDPLTDGQHQLSIIAYDNDHSPAVSSYTSTFEVEENCPIILVVSDNLRSNYQSENQIHTNGQVNIDPSQSIEYNSSAIKLNPGFHAKAGSTFKASINPCNN